MLVGVAYGEQQSRPEPPKSAQTERNEVLEERIRRLELMVMQQARRIEALEKGSVFLAEAIDEHSKKFPLTANMIRKAFQNTDRLTSEVDILGAGPPTETQRKLPAGWRAAYSDYRVNNDRRHSGKCV